MREALLRTFIFSLLVGAALAQHVTSPATPLSHAPVIRVTLGSSTGMSGCFDQTIVESGGIRSIGNDPETDTDQEGNVHYYGCPTATRTKDLYAIRRRDWKKLQHSAKNLALLNGLNECSACSDGPEEWLQLDFGDGKKKAIHYDPNSPSPALSDFLGKLSQIERKRGSSGR